MTLSVSQLCPGDRNANAPPLAEASCTRKKRSEILKLEFNSGILVIFWLKMFATEVE